MQYLLQTIISYGVPAVFTLIVIGFAAKAFRGDKKSRGDMDRSSSSRNNGALKALYDDIYGDQQQPDGSEDKMFQRLLRPPSSQQPRLPYNSGIPQQEYLKITHWNPQLDSFQYSLQKATQSKASAAATYRRSAWQRAWGQQLGVALEAHQQRQLVDVEQRLLQVAVPKQQQLQTLQTSILSQTMDQKGQQLGFWNATTDEEDGASNMYQVDVDTSKTATTNATAGSTSKAKSKGAATISTLQQKVATLEKDLAALELEFIAEVVAIVGPELAPTVRTLILGNSGNGMGLLLSGTERPVTQLLSSASSSGATVRPRTFVLRFPGDPTASQVETLRQEITALTLHARSGIDHVVVVLQTGGGTVTGYGLAAAQLLRIKQEPANLHLTICVEQVAAVRRPLCVVAACTQSQVCSGKTQ